MLELAVADRFLILDCAVPGEFVVTPSLSTTSIGLERYPHGETVQIEPTDFLVRHNDGKIVQTVRAGQKISTLSVKQLLGLFEPEGRKPTSGEMADWKDQFEDLIHAATKQFYANRFIDERRRSNDYSKTEENMVAFITMWHGEATARGFGGWIPSASTIRKLVYGQTGYLTLADCLRKKGVERKRKIWPAWVYELSDEAIDRRFAGLHSTPGEAYHWFFGQFHKERDEGIGIPEGKRPTVPTERVFSTWLKKKTTPVNEAKLLGDREANRRWKGTITPQDAAYPLHIVVIDQTLGNIWSAVKKRTPATSSIDGFEDYQADGSAPVEEAEILSSKRVEVVYDRYRKSG